MRNAESQGRTTCARGDILAELLKTVKIEDILKSDKHNFVIRNSEITKVELKECRWSQPQWAWVDLNILTSERKYNWNILGIPKKMHVKFKDYEHILRALFVDKLSVRLQIIPES